MVILTFLGATGTVTGSRYLVEVHGTRILIDAGLFQGKKELRLRNWEPFPVRDAQEALGTLTAVPFGQTFTIKPGIDFRYHRQGHILGAAAVELQVKVAGGDHIAVYFSGDVGRYDVPILREPEPYPGSTYLVVESTYGNRLHDPGDPRDQLPEVVNEAAARKGIILVPAFAIDRTQELLYFLRELVEDESIAPLPIFLDSPMAREATVAYRSCALEHDAEMRALMREGVDPLVPPNFEIVGRVDESKRLNSLAGPAIIISASGMATGGRILHHLKHRLPDPTTTVVFAGFQAEGTRGRRLLEGEDEVKIFGEMIPVRPQVRSIPSLSAHADADELTIWASGAATAQKRSS